MQPICDFHAHIFPDAIAEKAVNSIGDFYGLTMEENGRLSGLVENYDRAGIWHAVIHSVAIRPGNVGAINAFIADSVRKYPDRLTGYAAIHPQCPDFSELIQTVKALGLKGFKIHPDMQKFALDDPSALEMFDAVREAKLPILIHTGDCRYEYSNPVRLAKVLKEIPGLVCIAAHFGGYSEWEDGARFLSENENVWIDTSSTLGLISLDRARKLIGCFDENRILFGTDFPMWDASEELKRFHALGLSDSLEEKILWKNAEQLLN